MESIGTSKLVHLLRMALWVLVSFHCNLTLNEEGVAGQFRARSRRLLSEDRMNIKSIHELTFSVFLSMAFTAGVVVAAQQSSTKPVSKHRSSSQSSPTPKEDEIAQGRYLVEEVARCSDCHTPRDSNGVLDRSRWLQGAPVWIMPTQSKEIWASHAPNLASFPYSDQQAQDILERGIGPNGIRIQAPMHAYHLHHTDAVAIIAYLRSLSNFK
jgi:mono/diheme cytochrome c family protein